MKNRNYKFFLLALLLAFASCSFTNKTFTDPNKDRLLMRIITYVLEKGHYKPIAFDDHFSETLFSDYIKTIDPVKRYFYASDINDFNAYKYQLDDQIKAYDASFFKLVHERLIKRFSEVETIYKDILSKPFDYTKDESIDTDHDKMTFVKTKKQMRNRWRKQLKLSTLSTYDDLMDVETQKQKDDANYVAKKPQAIEAEARAATLKSINIYFNDNIEDLRPQDWFDIFINTMVEEFDPHTYYLPPKSKEDFDQRMSGKLEGIGAQLTKRMGNIKVVKLISGGPAWRSKQLDVEDLILKVKQEDEKFPVSIVGMRISDAVKYIKGPKGSKVTLTIKKADGTVKDIVITRDVVQLEETYAKAAIVEKKNKKFGIISLPSFYVDFKKYKELNAAKDVKKAIERLKSSGMQGLILDLRNNGGGSLPTVVDMAGLFIKDGPIVQVRSTGKNKKVLNDTDSSISWDGALVILVNEISASASEIMAAAMQDYKRAIIIGGKQTYGKGTVQNVLDLNRLVENSSAGDLGALALTTQKYYRINGGSVQLKGVQSDIQVPSRLSFVDIGERDTENPLPYDQINPADYKPWTQSHTFDNAIAKSKIRVKNNPQLKLIESSAKWAKDKMDKTIFSLNYKTYKSKIKLDTQATKRFEAINNYQTHLKFESLPYEKRLFKKDTTDLQEKRKHWHEQLSKDVYIDEALNVLEDLNSPLDTPPSGKVVITK